MDDKTKKLIANWSERVELEAQERIRKEDERLAELNRKQNERNLAKPKAPWIRGSKRKGRGPGHSNL